MSLHLLHPDVIRVPLHGDRDNCFLVRDEDGYTLVDAGWKSAPAAIRQALEDSGDALSDIKRIVITHAHPDHVRGLAELSARTSAEVLIHHADAPWLTGGRVPREGRSGAVGHILDRIPLLHWQPVQATRTVEDGERIGSLTIIHTPGHSPGHIALMHETSRTLFVGDAVFHRDSLATGPDAMAADPAARDESYARLPRDANAVGFAHGAPLTGGEVDIFGAWLSERQPPIN